MGKLFCQDHSRRVCEKEECNNKASFITKSNNYYCGVHKQKDSVAVDVQDVNLYNGTLYSQYDKQLWIEGKGDPTVLSYISRIDEDNKIKLEMNNKKIKNNGSIEGLVLEEITKQPEYGDDIPYVVTSAEFGFHINGNICNTNIGDRIESIDTVLSGKKPIDYNYYLCNQLFGQLARIINGLEQFSEGQGVPENDAKSQTLAKKYLEKYLKNDDKSKLDTGKEIKKNFAPIVKESISELNISSQFAKLLSTEGINRSNVNKRIEECFKCNSISRSFIN